MRHLSRRPFTMVPFESRRSLSRAIGSSTNSARSAVLVGAVAVLGASAFITPFRAAPRAPFAAMSFVALWLLVRSRRERLALAISEQVDVEVTASFYVLICAATVAFATFLAPTIGGAWFPGHELVCVLAPGAALAAWGLRRFPRTGRVLAVLTIVVGVWVVAVGRFDGGTGLAPPHGPLPWTGVERVLPRIR